MLPLEQVLLYFPTSLRRALQALPPMCREHLEEIRLRRDRPVIISVAGADAYLAPDGLAPRIADAMLLTERDAGAFLEAISRASLYAVENEVRQGYITLPGGHRVGICGEAVMDGASIRTIKNVSGFNVRLARQIWGAADAVLPRIVKQGRLLHSLIISAPGCGKTTLLRDLVRQISNGVAELPLPGLRVAIADERSELAACFRGTPQLDVGVRTDVLDGCPKAIGVQMLLRSMSPQVIATDEIGGDADAVALEEALNCGVTLLATAHGATLDETRRRPALARLLRRGAFERVVVLSRKRGPGTVEEVVNLRAGMMPSAVETQAEAG